MALLCRLAMGGVGAPAGAALIVLVVLVGLAGRAMLRKRKPLLWHALLMGVVAAVAPLVTLVMSVPRLDLQPLLINVSLPQAILNMFATGVASFAFLQARRFSAERDLLTAALVEAPDRHYVKDRQSRFAAANTAVAHFFGFDRAEDVVGKTDFDLVEAEQAAAWFSRKCFPMTRDGNIGSAPPRCRCMTPPDELLASPG
jgi:PAS domain-containing protein